MDLIAPIAQAGASAPSAGGAAIGQVVIATVMVSAILGGVAFALMRHRAGKSTVLARAADMAGRILGLPYWAALPSVVLVASLLTAVFGVYWDVSIHIDTGRDDGPLANLAHYPILFGLIGMLCAGWLAIALPRPGDKPGPAAVRIAKGWYAPVGGIVIAFSAAFGLAGFPLDDVWHRIFGQDVTLWGPTHLMMIGGAVITLIGQALLLAEGLKWQRAQRGEGARAERSRIEQIALWVRRVSLGGGILIAVDVFAMEFDFGVPQFAAVFQPLLLAFGAGLGLVATRLWAGKGGALAALAFYCVVRVVLTIIVGPILGETAPAMPLFLVEAICVEVVALALASRSPLTIGVVAGALCGTAGFAGEWAWSQLVMPIPWQPSLLPEGAIFALVGGLAGGVLGALLSSGLRGVMPAPRVTRVAAASSLLALGIAAAFGLSTTVPSGEARVTLTETSASPREVIVEARFQPSSLAEDATWANVTAWQGGGLGVEPLTEVEPGVWRSDAPIPVSGEWKSLIRVHDGNAMGGIPVFLPEDSAIPAAEVPASPTFTRAVVPEKEILQREVTRDSGALWTAASTFVLALYIGFVLVVCWGVGRVARREDISAAEREHPADAPEPELVSQLG
ncbi:MAG: hypothetical protein ACR2OC_02030 [Solirubrobacterales bacterium]